MSDEWVNKQAVVIARTGPGEEHAVGVVVSRADFPTVGIVTGDGQRIHWAEHLCEELSAEAAAEYWRQRAEAAEEQRDRALDTAMRAQDRAATALDTLNRWLPKK